MCNRYIARRLDLRRLGLSILHGPEFEEFTEKVNFDTSKVHPSHGNSSRPAGHGGAGLGVLHPDDQPEEHRPNDYDLVVRVVGDEMRLDRLKWGLIPPHEPEPKITYATFNAKAETIATTRAFKHAWMMRQRCLVPVEAFFEWKGDKSPKQKYRISVRGESQFCLAGLWERWEKNGHVLETYTVITCPANELVAEIHTKKRMPVILRPDDHDYWLHDLGDVTALLKPYPSDGMEAVPVESKRKSQRDQGPSLFE